MRERGATAIAATAAMHRQPPLSRAGSQLRRLKRVRRWDVATSRLVWRLEGEWWRITPMAVSPDGRMLVYYEGSAWGNRREDRTDRAHHESDEQQAATMRPRAYGSSHRLSPYSRGPLPHVRDRDRYDRDHRIPPPIIPAFICCMIGPSWSASFPRSSPTASASSSRMPWSELMISTPSRTQ
jgi:hypothetical protein